MNSFRYTNPTSSDWNVDLYSRQVGGDQCNMVCKKKCKKNCSTLCQIVKSDKTEFKEVVSALKEKRAKLKEKLKEMEMKEKEYEQKRIRVLIDASLSPMDRDLLYRLKKGGTRQRKEPKTKRKTRKEKTKNGGFWFSNSSSLAPCEKSCTDKCESQCKPICTDAYYLAHDSTEITGLKYEIKLLESSIQHIASKLNL